MKTTFLVILLIISRIAGYSQVCPAISSAWNITSSTAISIPNSEDLTTDDYGNIYVIGHFGSSINFTNGTTLSASSGTLYIAKFNPDSTVIWAINAGGNSSVSIQSRGISVSPDGSNIYITGFFSNTVTFGSQPSITSTIKPSGGYSNDVFVAKLRDTGGLRTWQWAVKAGGISGDKAQCISMDNAGKLYIGGVLEHYDTTGGGDTVPYDEQNCTFGSLPIIDCIRRNDLFVARLTDTGTSANWDWVRSSEQRDNLGPICTADGVGGISMVIDEVYAIATNKTNGDVFITGTVNLAVVAWAQSFYIGSQQFQQGANFDMFVSKLDTDGNWQWATRAGGVGINTSGSEDGRGIEVDSVGNIYVAGDFETTMRFGMGSNEITTLSSAGLKDAFVGKLNVNGTWAWAKRVGGNSYDYAGGIDYLNGQVWAIGTFTGTADFKTAGQLTSAGSADIFLARFDKNGNWLADGATRAGGAGVEGDNSLISTHKTMCFDVDITNVPCAAGKYTGTNASFGNTTLTRTGTNPFIMRLNCGQIASCTQIMSAYNPASNNNTNFKVMTLMRDASGNIYLGGKLTGITSFTIAGNPIAYDPANGSAIVVQINTNNQVLWVVQGGGTNAIINDIEIQGNNIVVTGDFFGTANFVKFDNLSSGTTTTTESFTSAGLNDIFVATIETRTGITHWNWILTGGGVGNDHATAISTVGIDGVFITGYVGQSATPIIFNAASGSVNIPNTLGNYTLYVAKILLAYNPGQIIRFIRWAYVTTPTQPNTATTISTEIGTDIVTNLANEAYIVGFYQFNDAANPSDAPTFGTTTLLPTKADDIVVAKLNSAGSWVWATKAGNNAVFGSTNRAYSIALGSNDDIYISGRFITAAGDFLKFGNTNTSEIPALTNTQGYDILVAKLNSLGQWQWANKAGGSGTDIGGGVAYKNGKVHLTGSFEATVNFGGVNLTSAGNRDYYFARLTTLGQWLPNFSLKGGGIDNDLTYIKGDVNATHSLVVDTQENDYTTGFHTGVATFGTSNLTNAGVNAVVIKTSCGTCSSSPISLLNPTHNIPTANPEQKTSSNIIATNFVTSGNVLYQAGTFIQLNAGFKVENGVVFKAQLGGCN